LKFFEEELFQSWKRDILTVPGLSVRFFPHHTSKFVKYFMAEKNVLIID